MKQKSEFLKVAIEAAKKAEKILLKYYNSNLKVNIKKDFSPVSVADIKAQKIIIETIRKYFPSHGFIGEESKGNVKNNDFLWIIDPIDGTKNYLRGIPIFATQIALMRKGELILGVSNAPALKELMYAEKGGGAYLNDSRVHVSTLKELNKSYMLFGGINYFKEEDLLKNLLSLIDDTRGHRNIGEFWSFHLVAQGKADIMAEAKIKIWDIAAQKVIIEEAGGKVTDMRGNKIDINTDSVLATNGKLHQIVLDYLRH